MLRLFNRLSDTDDPFMLIESGFELLVWIVNIEFSLADSSCEGVNKFTAKYQGEGFLVKEIGILAGDPAFGL